MPQEIQDAIKKNRISFAHGRALLEIDDKTQQRRLAEKTISNKLSVRELENLIRRLRQTTIRKEPKMTLRQPHLTVWEEELQRILATKVRISQKKKRGHILIEFYSQEELKRIVDTIRGE